MTAVGLDPAFRGTYREALAPETVGGETLQFHEHVFVDIAQANKDVSSARAIPTELGTEVICLG